MAIALKLLLLKDGDGNGLAAIRKRESDLIDISAYENATQDPTITTNPGYIIKNNTVYRVIKTYIDLDKNARIFIAKKDHDHYDNV